MPILKRKNIGRVDQTFRIGISFALMYYGFLDHTIIQDDFSSIIIGVLGTLNLIVAFARFCPLYSIVDINTASGKNKL